MTAGPGLRGCIEAVWTIRMGGMYLGAGSNEAVWFLGVYGKSWSSWMLPAGRFKKPDVD